ncbi:hypothetical protein [Rhodoplanes sp. Z2-YC6860]|uniref:hypothetical protein n=1 Tax=Rhodoplanes sp. Z2-YC6860 TaxID=674703 RepID=UPI00082AF45C|nr:hypothetical protein [Rhodoplanes sp. Z2-YC6860]
MRRRIISIAAIWLRALRNGGAPQTFLRDERTDEDDAMENPDSKSSRLNKQWRRYEQSETTVAAIFGGIAALFIAGIAAAFLYAKDTNPIQSASAPLPPVTSNAQTSTAQAPDSSPPVETTGSGANNTPQPKQQAGQAGQKKQ